MPKSGWRLRIDRRVNNSLFLGPVCVKRCAARVHRGRDRYPTYNSMALKSSNQTLFDLCHVHSRLLCTRVITLCTIFVTETRDQAGPHYLKPCLQLLNTLVNYCRLCFTLLPT